MTSIVYSLVPEAPLGGSSLLAGLIVVAGFVLGLRLYYRARRRHGGGESVLILGRNSLGRQVIEAIERSPRRRYTIVSVTDDAENLGRAVEAARPDRIVVALAERRGCLPLGRLVETLARGIVIEDAAEAFERLTRKLALEALSPSRVIFSRDFRPSRLQRALARTLSLLASVIGGVILLPVIGLIALSIKLDSRGPVFFVQDRVGLGGRSFRMIKFRTMHPVTRPTSEWERDNYDRITGVGRWLRRLRLDELPQLVNVLRGDMNFVGPRPHPVTNRELMILVARNLNEVTGDAIPYYALRCAIKPGITGWAQIRYGYANGLHEETEKLRYDLYYIKHMSLWLDLRILVETARMVLLGTRRGMGPIRVEPPVAQPLSSTSVASTSIAEGLTQVEALVDHVATLKHRIETRTARLTIIGQGYVGLPLAVELATAGFPVTGLDTDLDRVSALNFGRSGSPDVTDADLTTLVREGRYEATADFAVLERSDVVIVCVPTPLRKSKDPDISYVVAAAGAAAGRFRPPQLVVLESTTYPGTTEELLLPMFQERGARVGEDLFLAFSPERIDPGNRSFTARDIPKVVAGITPACTALAGALYRQIVPRVHPVSSPKVAELAKLYENVFRNVNIALANEFALMCRRLGVDTKEVIDAAATKPFGFMPFYPGPGIGGHCIPVDPLYLAWKMRLNGYEARFIALADEINRAMPGQVVALVTDALNTRGRAVRDARILALGVAYKRGVGDVRESPALEILGGLRKKGAHLAFADPHVPAITVDGTVLKAVELTEPELEAADCVLILTDHPEFDYRKVVETAALVVDTRNATWGLPAPAGRTVRL